MDSDLSSSELSRREKKPKNSLFEKFFSYMDAKLPSDRLVLYVLLLIVVTSASFTALALNKANIIAIPSSGGALTEGIIGTPHFVNPVLASSRADHDLVALIYSGLMKLSPEGELIADLAESITISDDGLVYNVLLKQGKVFHDATAITAADVAYTISLIQDPILKSPVRGNWTGVEVEVLSNTELNFVLESPYAPFMENLTIGILPKHIWDSLSIDELPQSQHNIEPVGSGPYRVQTIERTKSGLINQYTLTSFGEGQNPNIDTVILSFYQNEGEMITALENKEITSAAILSYSSLTSLNTNDFTVIEKPLPRIFSVFFNQNKSAALRETAVRKALDIAIDREALVQRVLQGYGTPTASPVPPGFISIESIGTTTEENLEASSTDRITQAKNILVDAGWEQDETGAWKKEIDEIETTLSVRIATENSVIFEQTAAFLEQAWTELGVEVDIGLFEQSSLIQDVIRRRDYQALLFGADVGRQLDFYPFWHSSQREDPGLNVALYTNITTDAVLENARITQDKEEKIDDLRIFEKEVTNEIPAIFLYSPSFVYVLDSEVKPTEMTHIARPDERFSNTDQWHITEQNVWQMFAQ